MNCNEEFVINALGKLTLEMDLDWEQQRKVRNILHLSLSKFEVLSLETGLVASDLEEKVALFMRVKKLENYSEETLSNYFYTLRHFAQYVVKPVATINKNDIRFYLASTSDELKASTVNCKIHILKVFFQWLEDEEIIPKNPTRQIKTTKVPKRLGKSLTIEEIERVRIACATHRERALLEFLFATGCRVSEICALNVSDLDMYNNSVKVIGKGDKERRVFFSSKTKLYLNKYLEQRTDNNPALFVSKNKPYPRMGVRGIEVMITNLGKKSGIDKSLFPHRMRHSLATISLASGANITTIQKILGHTSIETSLRYAQVQDEDVKHEYGQRFIH